jgi:ADP-heptose:LPS heptosyltransferase
MPNNEPASQRATELLRRQIEQISRILLIRLRSLGDSILTLPLIEALHQWRPELKLDILIESPYAPVFENHPAIHEVLELRARKMPDSSGWPRLQAVREIWNRRYPAVINLHGGTTSRLFTAASRAKLRLGEKSHRGSWIYNAQIPSSSSIWQRQSLHTVEHLLAVMRWLGLPIPSKPTGTLFVAKKAWQHIQSRLAQEGISNYLLIQPTATLPTKQWQTENFAQLGDLLYKKHGLPVIYAAASWELPILEQIRQKADVQHTYWADLQLMDLFALIEGCRLFIGNDSGPTHAAAALKKPIVVIWGSSNFQVWHPWEALHEAVRLNLPCIPCPGYTCKVFGDPKCILDIPVTSVSDACNRFLSRAL